MLTYANDIYVELGVLCAKKNKNTKTKPTNETEKLLIFQRGKKHPKSTKVYWGKMGENGKDLGDRKFYPLLLSEILLLLKSFWHC